MRLVLTSALDDMSDDELLDFSAHSASTDARNKFQRATFRGWKAAQEIVVGVQRQFWQEGNFTSNPARLYHYRNFQRLLDCILWHHFGPDMADLKRVFETEAKIQDVAHHNISFHQKVASEINESPDRFALITDLTSGVRLGDILLCEVGAAVKFVEVKSGNVNSEIFNAFHSEDKSQLLQLAKDKSKRKQVERILRQTQHSNQLMSILKNGVGLDKEMGNQPMQVHSVSKAMECFDDEMRSVLQRIQNGKITATEIIEDCLLIVAVEASQTGVGVRDKIIEREIKCFDGDATHQGIGFDLVMVLNQSSVMRPIYLQPFEPNDIHALIARRIHVYIYLSFEKFRNRFSNDHCRIDFLEGRSFRKRWENDGHLYALKSGNSILQFTLHSGADTLFSNGLFQRVPSNLVKPSYLAYMHAELLRHMDGL